VRIRLVFVAAALAACATGSIVETGPDGGGDASTGGDAATKDAGKSDAGSDASTCTAPSVKCATDAGSVCANLSTDVDHCGQCPTQCTSADAGGLAPGPNNPDAAVPYDGGSGWSLGAPSCDAGACGTSCPSGMTECGDGICYDTQNFHDHCGDCNTACAASTEWCNRGHCCALDQEWCGGACVDVTTDKNNCGGCGVTCSGNTPYCSQGTCVAACTPTGTRQGFNTLTSHTTTGCWTGQPCAQGTYLWDSTHGQSFINANEDIVCGGTTACVDHVGITTYELSGNCQGSWDVYCDATKVGTIDTTNKACQGDAMTNGCSVTFGGPMTCSTIRFVGVTGSVGLCCGSTGLHSMITGVSAW